MGKTIDFLVQKYFIFRVYKYITKLNGVRDETE
jgi:hypothetical protein